MKMCSPCQEKIEDSSPLNKVQTLWYTGLTGRFNIFEDYCSMLLNGQQKMNVDCISRKVIPGKV